MRHLLAVYGTLKEGFGNNRLLQHSTLLGEEIVSGFKMYSLGGFPAINRADEDSNIKIEVYEVTDPEILSRVYRLEGYSGERDSNSNWYDTADVPTKWGSAEIFYFKKSLHGDRPVVETGNWER
jgi:gamma-glutamylcyclotransferase (GGCT)/AIG2-like uncharacterized protein YtfP